MNANTSMEPCMYTALAEKLRHSVQQGNYQPGERITSEHALARQQSVSRVTVRKASEILVNEGLIERRPGKGLYVSANPTPTQLVQVIAGNLRWEPCLQAALGVKNAARQVGIQAQLYDAQGDEESDLEMVRQLQASPMCGAIVLSFHSKALNREMCRLEASGFPFVLVDQRLHDIDVPSVTADNASGGRAVGQALVELGHRRIGFIGDLVADSVRDRLAGLRDAMGDAGLPFDRSLVKDLILEDRSRLADWSTRSEACVHELMQEPEPPTAIFCSCDAVARAAFRALNNMGLDIPGDISVVGYDNDPLIEWLTPSLSTVRQPFVKMGEAAVALLCKRMADPTAAAEHVVLPVEYVGRDSTASPRSEPDPADHHVVTQLRRLSNVDQSRVLIAKRVPRNP